MVPNGIGAPEQSSDFSISELLNEERSRDLLRFFTAGSVDDGKSTLIGRLLYDTQSVYEDQLQSIAGKGTTPPGVLDLALLTDGLRAEREQGITIDVAYRYFSTAKRRFIIADTPGHEEYTRNMASGASTASLAVVLVDARKGILLQSRRHACISALLGVRHVIVAVNKMDLVGYSEPVFRAICTDFELFFERLRDLCPQQVSFLPVSALTGENVVCAGSSMSWYQGPSLLDLLESAPNGETGVSAPFRLPVQRVIRPNQDFRGFAGQVASGTIRPGDAVMVQPSGRMSRIRSIRIFDQELPQARAPQSVTVTLDDELDISRGDVLVSAGTPASVVSLFTSSLVWMDERPLDCSRPYLLRQASRTVSTRAISFRYCLDVSSLEHLPDVPLGLNKIGVAEIETSQPLVVDLYEENRAMGSFILIDPVTYATVAGGMVRCVGSPGSSGGMLPVTADDRIKRWRHRGAHLHLTGPSVFLSEVERALFDRGVFVVRLSSPPDEVIETFTSAGALVLTHIPSDVRSITFGDRSVTAESVEALLHLLEAHAILLGAPGELTDSK